MMFCLLLLLLLLTTAISVNARDLRLWPRHGLALAPAVPSAQLASSVKDRHWPFLGSRLLERAEPTGSLRANNETDDASVAPSPSATGAATSATAAAAANATASGLSSSEY